MSKKLLLAVAALLLLPASVHAEGKVRVGVVTTLSGPNAIVGGEQKDGYELALDHLGRKMGGSAVELLYEDDQQKPEIAKQVTEKLIQSSKVDFLTGYIWSNVLLSSLKPAVDAQTFLLSSNAGPSQVAGELCSPWFFSLSWQADQTPMAMGETLNKRGIKKLYILAPNYAAGKDMAAGVKSTFKGEVIGEEYTRWPGQLDFMPELTKIRAAKPDAIWVFYPGASGQQFFQQYAQSGLKETTPLYSVFTTDALSLPVLKDMALGALSTQSWVNDVDVPANKKFVAEFRKKYGRFPTYYASNAYDTIMLMNAAVTEVKGDLTNRDGIRAALRKADFQSTRGKISFNNNHFPIQNYYLQEVVKDQAGEFTLKTLEVVYRDHKDPYHDKCPMKW
jgi:branched-chain amino acid transport system substrate-binding protein